VIAASTVASGTISPFC